MRTVSFSLGIPPSQPEYKWSIANRQNKYFYYVPDCNDNLWCIIVLLILLLINRCDSSILYYCYNKMLKKLYISCFYFTGKSLEIIWIRFFSGFENVVYTLDHGKLLKLLSKYIYIYVRVSMKTLSWYI